jgi:hypothetical protein
MTPAKLEPANRLFFRLCQCANLLHKPGTRAVEAELDDEWVHAGAEAAE